jgi:hypothetical protein
VTTILRPDERVSAGSGIRSAHAEYAKQAEYAAHAYHTSTVVMWLAFALAIAASAVYILIERGALPVGNLQPAEQPSSIVFTAAACYLAGGFLILARRRWLWLMGAVMNATVILFYMVAYQDREVVLYSTGGLISKALQLVLETSLIYLILNAHLASLYKPRR